MCNGFGDLLSACDSAICESMFEGMQDEARSTPCYRNKLVLERTNITSKTFVG